MPTTAGTTSGGLPYPGDLSAPDVPAHLKALADAVEARFQAGVEVQTLQGATGPQLNLYHTAASTDRKRVRLSTISGVTKLAARNDADSADVHVGFSLDNATGSVDFPSGISGTGATFAGALRHTGSTLGFFNATPVAKPGSTTDLKTALANLGLITGGGASPLDLNGGAITAASAALSGNLNAGNVAVGSIAGNWGFLLSSDTDLYRNAPGRLRTSGEFMADGLITANAGLTSLGALVVSIGGEKLRIDSNGVGFFGVTPVARTTFSMNNGASSFSLPNGAPSGTIEACLRGLIYRLGAAGLLSYTG
jgi:hypothetical protein